MGLLDKFKEIITENDDDFDDYYDDDDRDYGLAAPERAERTGVPPGTSGHLSRSARNARAAEDEDDKVVNGHTTARLQVVLVKPETV